MGGGDLGNHMKTHDMQTFRKVPAAVRRRKILSYRFGNSSARIGKCQDTAGFIAVCRDRDETSVRIMADAVADQIGKCSV